MRPNLTCDASETIVARLRREPAFARGALAEAVTVFLGGEPEVARLMLRDIVNGTLGFEKLSDLTGIPPKSLHRMLSARGNPGMDNLAAIFEAMTGHLRVDVEARAKKKAA
ncbi:DNA-binding protein [Parvibaculum sp.]|uniref:helix-turn-helix domain-containing transcriptional regulator n=1 Tax=Parvibaculum sp. TaxID=2024848 RepID=UPI00272A1506|nr:transcriptional regulator [Parvibaculum sp.]